MIAVDTSVAVAAFGDWHARHRDAVAVINQGASIPVHALLETYSVLTGFPPPHRAAPDVVRTWLDARSEHVPEPLIASYGRSGDGRVSAGRHVAPRRAA